MRSLNKFVFTVCMLCSFSMAELRTCSVTLILANDAAFDYSYTLNKMSTTSDVMIGSPLSPSYKANIGKDKIFAANKFLFPDLPLNGKIDMQFTLREGHNLTGTPVNISMELSECQPENVRISSSWYRAFAKSHTQEGKNNPFLMDTHIVVYVTE